MKIVILDAHTSNPGDVSWSPLEAVAPCAVYPRTSVQQVVERCRGAEVVITNKVPLNREALKSLPELRYIGVAATGFNIVDVAAARELGVVVTNVPGYSTPGVAQHVFALILEITNHVGEASRSVLEGDWCRSQDFAYWRHPIFELAGKTLGIIGFGDIGAAVARIGVAFGMRVLASKRNWATPPSPGVQSESTETIFSKADVVSLHCPLSDETRQLVNERTLSLMKTSAVLINTGRGPLVDEAALAAALNSGKIAGAGLDVLSTEPPKDGNPLLEARNCVITPHVAWASRESRLRLIEALASNLRAFLTGSPVNVVNS